MKSLYSLKKCKDQESQKKSKELFLLKETEGIWELNAIYDPGLGPEPENTNGTAGAICIE